MVKCEKMGKCVLNDLSTSSILKCKYNLNKSELRVYEIILKSKKDTTMKDLVKNVGKDRTTIQRTINNLLDKKIIAKKQVNLHKGFMYTYYIHDKIGLLKELKSKVSDVLTTINKDLESISC